MQMWEKKKKHLCEKKICAEGDYYDNWQKWRQKGLAGLAPKHLRLSKPKLIFKRAKCMNEC